MFLHWEVEVEDLRKRIPAELEIDTWEGQAYIALVPFDMKGVTGRCCPAPTALCDFPEFNVRTYVTIDGKPGVWFFSLEVTSTFAVWAAQTFFHLPYRVAQMRYQNKNGEVEYYSQFSPQERFRARYRGLERVEPSQGSFADWATERYCLYTQSKSGNLYRGEIQHRRWPLYSAEVELVENTMLDEFMIGSMQEALYAPSIDVVVYPLEKLRPT